MFKDITNSMHTNHDTIHERHKLINKLRITSVHNEIYRDINKHMNRTS